MEEKDPLVPVNGVAPVNQQFGDDERDTLLLKAMASEAASFLEAFFWCKRILNAYFGNGIGGIVAVFLLSDRAARD